MQETFDSCLLPDVSALPYSTPCHREANPSQLHVQSSLDTRQGLANWNQWRETGGRQEKRPKHFSPHPLCSGQSLRLWLHLLQAPAPNHQPYKPWSEFLPGSLPMQLQVWTEYPWKQPSSKVWLQDPDNMASSPWFAILSNPGSALLSPGCCVGPSNTLWPIHIQFHLLNHPMWVRLPTKPQQVHPVTTLWSCYFPCLPLNKLSLREVKSPTQDYKIEWWN